MRDQSAMSKNNGKKEKDNSRKFTPKKKKFLESFAQTGMVSKSAGAAGISRRTHYLWLSNDPDYKDAFEDARFQALEILEFEARRRATEGVERLKFHKGEPITYTDEAGKEQVYVERQYSDVLLMFLLKSLDPEKYREHHEVRHGGEVDVIHSDKIRIIQDDDWYGNADRLRVLAAEASASNSGKRGKVQTRRRRKKMGKDGNGAAGDD